MILLLAALAAFGLWWWIGKKRRPLPGTWIGIAGTLIGTILMAKGLPVVGVVIATGSGLWLRYGQHLIGTAPTPPAPAPRPGDLSRAEAADLLGVSPGADRETIIAAYRRLMARNHPDAGGSAGLAAKLNAARDRLLKSRDQ